MVPSVAVERRYINALGLVSESSKTLQEDEKAALATLPDWQSGSGL
jgi:hypothetical protein